MNSEINLIDEILREVKMGKLIEESSIKKVCEKAKEILLKESTVVRV